MEIEQLTKEQAIAIYESGAWKEWSFEQRAFFQLRQDKLAMPFDVFHEAVEKTLGRPVWTHEFADTASLRAELAGVIPPPTMEQIMEPNRKRGFH